MNIKGANNINKMFRAATSKRAVTATRVAETKELPVAMPESKPARVILTAELAEQFWQLVTSLPPQLLQQQIVAYHHLSQQETAKGITEVDINSLVTARHGITPTVTYLIELQHLMQQIEQQATGKSSEFTEFCRRFTELELSDEAGKKEILAAIGNNWQINQPLLGEVEQWLEQLSALSQDSTDVIGSIITSAAAANAATVKAEPLPAKSLADVILPPRNNYPLDTDIKPLSQLLEEMVLPYSSNTASEQAKLLLAAQHQQVIAHYITWQNQDQEAIYTWAQARKGNFANNMDEICELIAVMARANELVTGGHQLRDSQILTLLVFAQNDNPEKSDNEHGRLCQVHTGEGKTTIVSLLAIIQAMQGHKVDIITSNNILAQEAVTGKEGLYSLFGLTVATNNPDNKALTAKLAIGAELAETKESAASTNKSGPRACYSADIVYGSIGNFQFDYLKDYFLGQATRGEREFEKSIVILDEVDSMLIDNGRHIAKLAAPFAGMESLRYFYIRIWQELEQLTTDIAESDLTTANQGLEFVEISRVIKAKINEDIELFSLLPNYLQAYVNNQLDYWIGNAIEAKYSYHENEQYIIKEHQDQGGSRVIVPVDYLNTGVSLNNTVWPKGLHQFLQLKHNLPLTIETLTNSHISNMGYIKKYGSKIYGMTGTLGSGTERELLAEIYQVDTVEIPTYKVKKFTELPGIMVADHNWLDQTILSILEQIEHNRSVLVICETIKAVQAIKQQLEFFNSLEKADYINKVTIYVDDDSTIAANKIEPREVIIATNIAGRGTDLGTSAELEQYGGLHVCVTFLPCNQRVEDQAFGRTSRQGNGGTAQLIIRESELRSLGLEELANVVVEKETIMAVEETVAVIKQRRSKFEAARVQEILDKAIELSWQDKLCDAFVQLCKEWQQANSQLPGLAYLLEDLKELWAFWLDRQVMESSNLPPLVSNDQQEQAALLEQQVEQQLAAFKQDVSILLTGKGAEPIDTDVTDGREEVYNPAERFIHSPYNAVKQAEFLLQQNDLRNNKLQQAINYLKQALVLGGDGKIASSYLKLFESQVTGNSVFNKLFSKLLAGIFTIGKPITVTESYKEEAGKLLRQADTTIHHEIIYLKTLLNPEANSVIFPQSSPVSKQIILTQFSLKAALITFSDLLPRATRVQFGEVFKQQPENMLLANNVEELELILNSLPVTSNGQLFFVSYQLGQVSFLDSAAKDQALNEQNPATLCFIKQNDYLQILHYDQYNRQLPYQVKWVISKYCQRLGQVQTTTQRDAIIDPETIVTTDQKEVIAIETTETTVDRYSEEITTALPRTSVSSQQVVLLANNLLVKHLYARLTALSWQKANIEELIRSMYELDSEGGTDFLLKGKSKELATIDPSHQLLTSNAITELINTGLGQAYALKPISITEAISEQPNLQQYIVIIQEGNNLLGLANKLPIIGAVIKQVAYLLITEGTTKLVLNILDQAVAPEYITAKVVSNIDTSNQMLTAVIEKLILSVIKLSQESTQVSKGLPEIEMFSEQLTIVSETPEQPDEEVNDQQHSASQDVEIVSSSITALTWPEVVGAELNVTSSTTDSIGLLGQEALQHIGSSDG